MPSDLHAECEAIYFFSHIYFLLECNLIARKIFQQGKLACYSVIIYRSIITQVKNLSKILARSC